MTTAAARGGLDGAVVDAEGLIWNARWGGGCVDVYTPEGERVRTIRVPARQPSCPVFVGANFDRLLVTSAWQGMDEPARAADPAPWPNLPSRCRRTGAARNLASGSVRPDGPSRTIAHEDFMTLAELQAVTDHPSRFRRPQWCPTMRRYALAPKVNRDKAAIEAQHPGSET